MRRIFDHRQTHVEDGFHPHWLASIMHDHNRTGLARKMRRNRFRRDILRLQFDIAKNWDASRQHNGVRARNPRQRW